MGCTCWEGLDQVRSRKPGTLIHTAEAVPIVKIHCSGQPLHCGCDYAPSGLQEVFPHPSGFSRDTRFTCFSDVGLRPVAWALFGSMREMQTLGPHLHVLHSSCRVTDSPGRYTHVTV